MSPLPRGPLFLPASSIRRSLVVAAACCFLAALGPGCSTPAPTDPRSIAKRRQQRSAAYAALPGDQQALVDQGQIRVGMSEDAVFIAWGAPAQVLRSGDQSGEAVTWLYESTTSDSYLTWNFREITRKDGSTYMDRFLDRDINVRSYVSAELTFRGGSLASYRTLAKPPGNTILAPQPLAR